MRSFSDPIECTFLAGTGASLLGAERAEECLGGGVIRHPLSRDWSDSRRGPALSCIVGPSLPGSSSWSSDATTTVRALVWTRPCFRRDGYDGLCSRTPTR